MTEVRPVADGAVGGRLAGPLNDVRVLELGSLIAGPFAGRLLADFGAEVIKVEQPPDGDPMREWGQFRHAGHALWWPVQSRNKKLVTLDLRKPKGQDLCRRLIAHVDVVIENFRPGTLEKWNLGPDRLQELNPGLIIARVSGYGQTGPYANRAGFAAVGEAMGGLRYINGYRGQPPPRLGISLGDSLAALFTVYGILAALHERHANGAHGQVIDTSIMESCFALLESMVPEYGALSAVREPTGTKLSHVAPSNLYLARDGRWIVIAANTENLWQRLCTVIEQPELASDPRFETMIDRAANSDQLDEVIAAWAAQKDAATIDAVLNEAGLACGLVYSIADIFEDPQFGEREMLVEVDDPAVGKIVMPGVVPKLSRTPGMIAFAGAREVGAHNEEVYGSLLGLSSKELTAFADEAII